LLLLPKVDRNALEKHNSILQRNNLDFFRLLPHFTKQESYGLQAAKIAAVALHKTVCQ
jgi:hypothetical protein